METNNNLVPHPKVKSVISPEEEGLRLRKNSHAYAVSSKYESLDYEEIEHELSREDELSSTFARKAWWKDFYRWVICFVIGLLTAILGAFVKYIVVAISGYKYSLILKLIRHSTNTASLWLPLLLWAASNAVFVTVGAVLCIYWAGPIAAGSGIPQVKCFLNGVKIPGVLRLPTFVAKVFGLICSVIGGLAVGKEGPMIHAGAVIGAGVSSGKSRFFHLDIEALRRFRNDIDRRDFVSAGAAAGVAAAFNAPIGGVLFAMEEGSSFWTQQLTWRTFFASITCYFFLNVILSIQQGVAGYISWEGLVNFGKVDNIHLAIHEIPIFLLMGVFGGLTGALFVKLNARISLFRMKFVTHRWQKLLEVVIVAVTSAGLHFLLIICVTDCHPISNAANLAIEQMWCRDGEYTESSFVLLAALEQGVSQLFHYDAHTFDLRMLAIFFVVMYLLTCWTYGLQISSGLFIPTLLCGACWGRFVGVCLHRLSGDTYFFQPSKYAIIGAAAQLGGVVRMTISITVIMMESLKNLGIGMPIMLAVMVAKQVGDYFSDGIYDLHIKLADMPLLPWTPPTLASTISARRVMSKTVMVLRVKERLSTIVDMLKQNLHHGYPVVSDLDGSDTYDEEYNWIPPEDYGTLEGFIRRDQLIVLLANYDMLKAGNFARTLLSPSKFHYTMRQLKEMLDRLELTDEQGNEYLDLSPYMNPSPYCVTEAASLRKLFQIIRQLGARHVVIINKQHKVLGLVTRKDVARYWEEKDNKNKRYYIQEIHVDQGE